MTLTSLSAQRPPVDYIVLPTFLCAPNPSSEAQPVEAHLNVEKRTNPFEVVESVTLLESRTTVYADRRAQLEIAFDCCDINNPMVDLNKGIGLLKNLALQGESQASMKLGLIYRQMEVSGKNLVNALFWFQYTMRINPLLDRECTEVCLELYQEIATKYWDGESSLKYLSRLANQKTPLAQYLLAFIYDKAKLFNIPPKPQKALRWYEEYAKEMQHADLYFDLGRRYVSGEGCSKSVHKAIRCFEQAELLGHERARIELGLIYFNNKKERMTMALGYLNTELDKNDPRVFFAFGDIYFIGLGVEKDRSKAIAYYEDAANKGHVKAQTKLGCVYAGDFGGPENLRQARHWFKEAVKENDCLALYKLGIFYYSGKGVIDIDLLKAFDYLFRLSSHITDEFRDDYPKMTAHFEYVLGLMYFEGRGTNQNQDEGLKWFRKASSHGQRQAKNYLKSLKF
ncbi:MAG: SEL1-like repeat protein [Alphaproteobacteria bacterium]|nr:SEL1-like repeat protein [Alphaproteobacteria bacterium]MBP9877997.1 SEL1-like repeat protein [Alphaproteobacteria bacterium]